MCRGVIVVITAGMSILFLKRKYYVHHYISVFMIIGGVAIVGYVSVNSSDKSKDDGDSGEVTTTLFGVLLLLLS